MKFLKKLFVLLLLVAVLALLAYLFRAPLLRATGRWWVVNDPVEQADVVLVLGGGTEWRPFAAAEIYRAGKARRVLVTGTEQSPTVALGAKKPDEDIVRSVLDKLGVPASAVGSYTDSAGSCRDEAHAIRKWADANHIKTLLIPTDNFNTRRVKWIFERQLSGTGISVMVQAVDPPTYNLENWWETEDGVVAFIIELVKYTYYRLNY